MGGMATRFIDFAVSPEEGYLHAFGTITFDALDDGSGLAAPIERR
jgi:hypothetical protein